MRRAAVHPRTAGGFVRPANFDPKGAETLSTSQSAEAARTARQARQITKNITSMLTGRRAGPDPEVRRDSYDVDDPRAKPWVKVGDGSVAQGLAHRDALLQAAEEFCHQSWKESPLHDVRAARERRAALAVELRQLTDGGEAPIGRPAALRQELAKLDEFIDRAKQRLRRIDITVLKALLRRIDYMTGRLFPAIETIAADAGCHRNSVVGALRRLKAHGFIDWVRRSMKTGNDGSFAPQREQTSNAYFFDHRRRMASRTWQRFWQILVAKLRRFGATPADMRPQVPAGPPSADVIEQRAAIASLGSTLANAST